jgi:hypothetical protein
VTRCGGRLATGRLAWSQRKTILMPPHAIYTRDLGKWRNGGKKITVLMGDAPPHTKKHTLDEVVKAAEKVDPANVFPNTGWCGARHAHCLWRDRASHLRHHG